MFWSYRESSSFLIHLLFDIYCLLFITCNLPSINYQYNHCLLSIISCHSIDLCPEAPSVLGLILDACGVCVAGSDRTGRTIFDLEEKVSRSCLSACKTVLARVDKIVGASSCTTPSLSTTTSGGDRPLVGLHEGVTLHKYSDLNERHGLDSTFDVKSNNRTTHTLAYSKADWY